MSDFGVMLTVTRASGKPCTSKDVTAIRAFLRDQKLPTKNRLNEDFDWTVKLNELCEPISVGVTVSQYWSNDVRDIHGIDLDGEADIKEFLAPDVAKIAPVQKALTDHLGDKFNLELYAAGW